MLKYHYLQDNKKNPKFSLLMNGFKFQYEIISKNKAGCAVDFFFPHSSKNDWFTNMLLMRKFYRENIIQRYDVLFVNCWESIFTSKKIPGQILIGESHGFTLGLNFEATIREIPIISRIKSRIMKFFFTKRMKRKIKNLDIYYVSTPNMLKHAKKIRSDAIWLPNSIAREKLDFKPKKIKLEGNPAIFLPTRLHVFKNPLMAFKIFDAIKEKYPEAKLHLVHYGQGADTLYRDFKKILADKETYIWHKRMNWDKLFEMYVSADLILGQFNENLANLSLVELEAMACGAPVVSLDRYEIIKKENDDLIEFALELLKNPKKKKAYAKKCQEYVLNTHSPEAVAKRVFRDIKSL